MFTRGLVTEPGNLLLADGRRGEHLARPVGKIVLDVDVTGCADAHLGKSPPLVQRGNASLSELRRDHLSLRRVTCVGNSNQHPPIITSHEPASMVPSTGRVPRSAGTRPTGLPFSRSATAS